MDLFYIICHENTELLLMLHLLLIDSQELQLDVQGLTGSES